MGKVIDFADENEEKMFAQKCQPPTLSFYINEDGNVCMTTNFGTINNQEIIDFLRLVTDDLENGHLLPLKSS